MLPISGYQVADWHFGYAAQHESLSRNGEALVHAYHCKVEADQFLQIMLELSPAEYPAINAVASHSDSLRR